MDFWGYYNGKLSNDPYFTTPKLVPGVNYYSNGDFQYTDGVRDPDFDYAKMYSLTKITYPTGGNSTFEYEPHQYSQRLERRSDNSFIPKLYLVNAIGGGTRIKKIYDFDGNSNQNIREFFYTNDNNQGSGILMDWPRYFFKIRAQTMNTAVFPVAIDETIGYVASSGYSKNLFEGSVMNYSKVTEKYTNKGSTVEYFTSYITNPDHYLNFNDQSVQLTDGTYTPQPSVRNIFMMPYDTSTERGKLAKRLVKDENNNLLEETDMLYNESVNRFNQYHVSINISNAWLQKLRTYYYNNFISSSTVKKYLNGNILQTESKYYYENPNHNMLTKTSTNFSDGTSQETFYQYAHEKNNQTLINANMIGVPLQTEEKKNGKTISKVETKYDKLYPSELYPGSIVSYSLDNGSPKTEMVFDVYGYYKNLEQYTTKEGIPVTLVWGYNYTKLIAKIEGIDSSHAYSTVLVNTISKSNLDIDEASEQILLTALDNLRKNSNFSNTQITTYTYDPLIGVTSITPPSGIREVYKYDSANRLEKIVDINGKIIKEFKYNYKQ